MRLREHSAIRSKYDAFKIDPRKLKVDPAYNVRDMNAPDTLEHVANLKALILANEGVHTPLEVRMDGDKIVIVAGHCRHAAVMELIREGHAIEAVPCVQEAPGTNEEDRVANLVVSNSGKPLSLLEKAKVVKRLVGFGWMHELVAERLGWKSVNSVRDALAMLEMGADVRDMVSKGDVSATTARKAVKKHGADAGNVLREAKGAAEADGKSKVTPKRVHQARPQPEPEEKRGALDKVVHAAMQGVMGDAAQNQRVDRERQEIIAALEPFAQWGALNGIDGLKDDKAAFMTVGDIRRAAKLWSRLSGFDEPFPLPRDRTVDTEPASRSLTA